MYVLFGLRMKEGKIERREKVKKKCVVEWIKIRRNWVEFKSEWK